jgi:CubicO group peptidase (beta-lactamase class C family)
LVRALAVVVALTLALLGLLYGVAVASTDRSAFARVLAWQGADADDWRRFPARSVGARGEPLPLRSSADSGAALLERVTAPTSTGDVPLDRFLAETQTTAFVVLRDDEVLIETYYGGADRLSVSASFSVAKSFLSSLVGLAIASGRISSVEDPVTRYVPELRERDPRFAEVRIRHLLSMSSGLRYEEMGLPWSDDSLTYYAPDLRRLALHGTRVERPPGEAFHYNNYNPLLLGLVLERAVGKPVATQLQDGRWGRRGWSSTAPGASTQP